MKRPLWIASILLVVGLFFAARNAASWRPQPLPVARAKNPVFEFSPDGHWLLIKDENPEVGTILWDWSAQALVRTVAPEYGEFSPDGRFLARVLVNHKKINGVWVGSTEVEIAETQSGRVVKAFGDSKTRDSDELDDARWTRDGKRLVVATAYGCRTFDVASGKVVARWDTQKPAARGSSLSQDGQQVARLLPTNSEIRRADNGQFISGLPFGAGGAVSVGFAPDSNLIYSVPSYNTGKVIHFWGAKATRQKLELVATIAASPPSPHFTRTPGVLAFVTPDGIELRRIPGGKVTEKLSGPTKEPFALAPDEKSAVSCDARGQIYRWRLR